MFGTNYGEGFFKLKACDYCDDVFNETADIVVGDAWLPEFIKDGKGNNVVIIRNKKVQSFIDRAMNENRLNLTEVREKDVIASQAGGFRHKRAGLSYRLYLQKTSGNWVPDKRVKPSRLSLSRKRRRIQEIRVSIRESSHILFKDAVERDDFSSFVSDMQKLTSKLKPSLSRRVARNLKKLLAR